MAGQMEHLFGTFSKMPAGILAVFLFCLLTLSSACYVQNCPRGGKRSIPYPGFRLCTPCGPRNRGKCLGPNVCCMGEHSCFGGPSAKLSCLKEKSFPLPCKAGGKPCGGRCDGPGICCNEDGCIDDPFCRY
ncbi:oxytocin-neurophysin 1-like [Vipera latastei]